MKKLIFAALAAFTIGTTFAITKEEAIASKNWNVICDYCKTNRLDSWKFIKENINYEDYKIIYNDTIPHSYEGKFIMKFSFVRTYGEESLTGLVCNYDIKYINSIVNNYSNSIISIAKWYDKDITYRCLNDMLVKDMTYGTNLVQSAKIAKTFYNVKHDTELIDILKPRVKNVDSYAQLICSTCTCDPDGIIDALKMNPDVEADIANKVIEIINAVSVDYRKDDTLSALQNLNGRCTIKLYDDQKTWEPILAKIRAMISVRK